MFAQEGEDFLAPEHRGKVGGRGAALVAHRVRPGVEEHPRDFDVALERDPAERRLPLLVAEVDLRPGLQQHRHGLGAALVGGDHQEGIALGVAQVDVESLLERLGQAGGLAVAGEFGHGLGQLQRGAHESV